MDRDLSLIFMERGYSNPNYETKQGTSFTCSHRLDLSISLAVHGNYGKLDTSLESGEKKMLTVDYVVNLEQYMQNYFVLCQQLVIVFKLERVQYCILVTLHC
jgi:hypothetical protein